MSAPAMVPAASSTGAAPMVPLAPGMTMMAFSPESATATIARPVAPATTRSAPRSTPASRRRAVAGPAQASSPTAPTMATSPPSSAAASAWFAPFPPGAISPPEPCNVSPGRGWRATRTNRSAFSDPTTAILAMTPSSSAAPRRPCRPSRR